MVNRGGWFTLEKATSAKKMALAHLFPHHTQFSHSTLQNSLVISVDQHDSNP
jgi:hypothetical protein